MPSFASVVVTYYPDAATIDHIKKLTSLCVEVIVVDNTPGNREIVPPGFFTSMLAFKKQMDKLAPNYALYVPNFFDRNSRTPANFPLLTPFTLKHATCNNIRSLTRDYAIMGVTSGSLLTYSRFKEIGPMRDDYFIDFIDNEYCLRISKLGFRVAINCHVLLDHAIGKRITNRFMGITIKPNYHQPMRRYYIARNGVRTAMDFLTSYPSYIALIFARMTHELFSIILYEGNKFKKIQALIYGIFHGIAGKMGECRIESPK
jgi:rhamnosyltransferase